MFIKKYGHILRAPADEGAASGVPDDAGNGDSGGTGQSPSMFKAGDGGDGSNEGSNQTPPAGENDRPDWLLEKFKSPEDQAKAYSEMSKSFLKKTDDLRAEIKDEATQDAMKKYMEERGVPEDVAGYERPEDLNFKMTDEMDAGIKNWAKENAVGKEGYENLLNLYNENMPDPIAEKEALGENADDRIGEMNRWLNANTTKDDHQIVEAIMTTAKGVEFMERFRDKMGDNNFAPGDVPTPSNAPKTRGEIREMQADKRFGDDPDYTAMVRGEWAQFAKNNPQ